MLNISISKGEVPCQIFQAKNQPVNLDRKIIPWKGEPSPLVSLLDMLKFCAKEFIAFRDELEALFKDGILDSSRPRFTPVDLKRIAKVIDDTSSWCKLLQLDDGTRGLIEHIDFAVKYHFSEEYIPSPTELGANILVLRNIINDLLSKRLFMFIPTEDAQWYEKDNAFGDKVSKAFPSATNDIKEAGNCFATARYTACVFHLMRVLEHGLKTLGKEVGVEVGRKSWGKIIGRIKTAIEDLYNPTPPKKSKIPQTKEEIEQQQFLSQAAVELGYFKDAWRNHVSHGRTNYERMEALMILNHVKSFMVYLSTQLSE